MKRPMIWVLSACLALGMTATVAAQNGKEKQDKGLKVKILNAGRVYYPKSTHARTYKKVGLLECSKVLNATPEYVQIAKDGIRRGTAEYDLLVKRASDRFKKAIRTTVSLGGYDLIAETGAVTVEGTTLPDISEEVIRNLPKI